MLIAAPRTADFTPADSEATIQAAIDSAAAGATIVLGIGTYNISLELTTRGLKILPEVPGEVTISGARSGSETWTDRSVTESTSDLWSCPLTYTPKQVLLVEPGGARYSLLDYGTLATLKTRTMPDNADFTGGTAGVGPVQGYAANGTLLYVRFAAGQTPTTTVPRIARNNIVYNVRIDRDDVTIEGLRLEVADTGNITVADDIQRPTIRDTYGEAAKTFFRSLGGTLPTNGIIIDHCEFNGGKTYSWRVECQKKEFWDASYSSNLGSRFIRANTRSIIIRHSYAYELFDGIELKGFDATSEGITCLIEYCVLDGVVDNHFEIEPWDQNIFIVAHHNFLKDGYTFLATAPFGGDRCEMRHNILWQSLNAINLNDTDAAKQKCTLLKTVSHGGIDARVEQQRGYRVNYNTIRVDGGAEARLYTGGDEANNAAAEQFAYTDSEFNLNIYDGGAGLNSDPWLLRSEPVPSGGTGTPSPAVGTARPGTGYLLKKNVIRGGLVTASDYQYDTGAADPDDTRPPAGDVIQTDPAFGTTPTTYFHPTNATILSRGDGAVQGGVWAFKGVPGPRWATEATMPQRRAWDSAVSKSYVNL